MILHLMLSIKCYHVAILNYFTKLSRHLYVIKPIVIISQMNVSIVDVNFFRKSDKRKIVFFFFNFINHYFFSTTY